MNLVQKIAFSYLVSMALLIWGYAVGRYQVFPYQYVEKVEAFVGFRSEARDISLEEKLLNELGVKPVEFLRQYPEGITDNSSELVIPGTRPRRQNAQIYTHPEHQEGYRALFGVMDFEDAFWGGVLVNAEGEAIHTWSLSTEHLPLNKSPDHQKNLYGLALLPDGSVIYNLQEPGGGIIRVSACGETMWVLEGEFHHTATMTEDLSAFWTFEGSHMGYHHVLQKVDAKTGEVLKSINMKDAYEQNEYTHIFYLQKNNFPSGMKDWLDISHGNDIEELPPSLASQYPAFNPGDLLISYRNHNLIFIMDPETLEIKWWRVGAVARQHDPDWESDGWITVFSNNSTGARKGFSDIVRINVETMEHEVIVDGKKHPFFSLINARQQLTDYGTRIITSSTQGWIFEVDDNDERVFSFVNTFLKEELQSLHVSDAFRYTPEYFEYEFWESCNGRPAGPVSAILPLSLTGDGERRIFIDSHN